MVRGKGKKIYSVGELKGLQEEKQELDGTIKHIEQNPGTARSEQIDVSSLRRQSNYLANEISIHTPVQARGANKDRLIVEANQIIETIKKNMPTKEEMDHPADHPGAIQKHLQWSEKNNPAIRRYKDLMRQIEPDDPTATSIERFRLKK